LSRPYSLRPPRRAANTRRPSRPGRDCSMPPRKLDPIRPRGFNGAIMAENKTKLTFEQALEKLEEIVAGIESGQVGLEESIARYAEGQELIKYCRGVLDSAEKKIQTLTNTQGDQLAVDGELPEPEDDANGSPF